MSEKEKATGKESPAAARFSFGQIVESNKYRAYRDLLSFSLDRGERYTAFEVDAKIKSFMERKVK